MNISGPGLCLFVGHAVRRGITSERKDGMERIVMVRDCRRRNCGWRRVDGAVSDWVAPVAGVVRAERRRLARRTVADE